MAELAGSAQKHADAGKELVRVKAAMEEAAAEAISQHEAALAAAEEAHAEAISQQRARLEAVCEGDISILEEQLVDVRAELDSTAEAFLVEGDVLRVEHLRKLEAQKVSILCMPAIAVSLYGFGAEISIGRSST